MKPQPTKKQTTHQTGHTSAQPFKDKEFARGFHQLMVRTRVLEEKLIKMARTGDGFFWIGGPGEEAFSVALGLQLHKGEGPAFDFFHGHYRSNGVVLAMGEPMINFIRQMKSSQLDSYSGGRNFVAHVAKREWNIVPITSPIETQFSVAPGTAMVQRRARLNKQASGITVVVGGDAGTAEGDFATCMIWSSRPNAELPVLMIVTNNGYGISTPANTQHGERNIADRGKAFGIETATTDGLDPAKVWDSIRDAMDYVRTTGKPYLLEVVVSRLYGHSSSSGANRIPEVCPIEQFEKKLQKQGWLTQEEVDLVWELAWQEANQAHEIVRKESYPDGASLHDHTFADNGKGGLPGREI